MEPRPALLAAGEVFGGVERHLLGMCQWLQSRGREALLVLFHEAELARQARDLGVAPVIIPVAGSFDPRGPGRLARILAEHEVNIVHAHGYRAVVNAALAGGRQARPMVRTVHGLVERGGGLDPARMRARLYRDLEEWAGRRLEAATCYVTDELRQRDPRAAGHATARTILNGMAPLDRDGRGCPAALASDHFHVAVVGRLTPVKGIDLALRAVGALDPGLPVKLHVVGTGPLAADLKALAAELELGDRVVFHGFRSDVLDFMAHCDALAMPSWHEGLPYTILEALSLGVPIVASRVGGLAEILTDRETALLVEAGDVPGLAGALGDLTNHPELSEALGAAGRDYQRGALHMDTMGQAYWDLYAELLAPTSAAVEGIAP